MTVAKELETANEKYAKSFTKGDLTLPPARKIAVIVCMDARIDPAAALGLQEGDAHVPLSIFRTLSDPSGHPKCRRTCRRRSSFRCH